MFFFQTIPAQKYHPRGLLVSLPLLDPPSIWELYVEVDEFLVPFHPLLVDRPVEWAVSAWQPSCSNSFSERRVLETQEKTSQFPLERKKTGFHCLLPRPPWSAMAFQLTEFRFPFHSYLSSSGLRTCNTPFVWIIAANSGTQILKLEKFHLSSGPKDAAQ